MLCSWPPFSYSAAVSANAQTIIDAPNGSFEMPTTPAPTSTNSKIVPAWVFGISGSAFGTGSIASEFAGAGAASGKNYAFLDGTNMLTSAASLTPITADTEYTLTVAMGNPNDGTMEAMAMPIQKSP